MATGEPRYAVVARDVLDYLDREMQLDGGGVASAQDADTEGDEGLTFVWTPAEVAATLGDDALASAVCDWYGITGPGNFEGSNVLSVVGTGAPPAGLDEARATMLAARELRPQPGRDDKALAAWNGMALAAYADAGRLLGEPRYLDRARDIATFLLGGLSVDGRLQRTWRDGQAKITGFSEDYGAVADGLIALHRATGELVWLDEARRLVLLAVDLFGDTGGPFAQTPRDGERLVARRSDLDDNPAPSGNSLLAGALLMLSRIYGEAEWEDRRDRGGRRCGRDRRPRAAGFRTRAGRDRRRRPPRRVRSRSSATRPTRAPPRCAPSSTRATRRTRRWSWRTRPTRCSRRCRCSRAARRSTASRRPTSASASPAGVPSRTRPSSPPSSPDGTRSARPAARAPVARSSAWPTASHATPWSTSSTARSG